MSDAVKDGRITEVERFDLHVLVGRYPSPARATLVRLGLIHAFDVNGTHCSDLCHVCREKGPREAPREALLAQLEVDRATKPRSYGCLCHAEPTPKNPDGSHGHWPSCPNRLQL